MHSSINTWTRTVHTVHGHTNTRHRAINESGLTPESRLTWTDPIYREVTGGFQEELEWWWDESGDKQLEGGWRKGGRGWQEWDNNGLSHPCSRARTEVLVWYCTWATLTHYTQSWIMEEEGRSGAAQTSFVWMFNSAAVCSVSMHVWETRNGSNCVCPLWHQLQTLALLAN